MSSGIGTAAASRERGSVLLLVPAAILVLIILGAIAVDSAIVFLGQRELSGLAAATANDVATAALSEENFYRGRDESGAKEVQIDARAVRRLAERAVELRAPKGVRDIEVETVSSGDSVCVTLRGEVDHVFAKAVPGVQGSTTVRGQAEATAVEDGSASPNEGRKTIC